ncbi:MAG: arginase family protein, partial [Myxococcales bacterium]|nr:arginase family protein [Myxococcales bacterium]
LTATVAGFQPIAPSRVLLVGTRDVDPLEEERLQSTPINRLRAEDLDSRLGEAVAALSVAGADVYVHIDLDVLDPSEGRANQFATGNGLSLDALRSALDRIRSVFRIRAVAFTAYDPAFDPERRIPPIVNELAELLLTGPASMRIAGHRVSR